MKTEIDISSLKMGDMSLLSREQILGAQDMVTEDVDVPEWGGKVRVKGMTGSERDRFEASLVIGAGKMQKINTVDIRAKLCAFSIVDANGKTMFSQADIAVLGAKSAAALDRVYDVAARLSKITKEDVDELAGNSDKDLSDSLSSG